jgi:hypothetical protein
MIGPVLGPLISFLAKEYQADVRFFRHSEELRSIGRGMDKNFVAFRNKNPSRFKNRKGPNHVRNIPIV